MYELLLQGGQWLGDTALSQYIQGDENMFPILEVIHVFAIALVIGPILLLDLRLISGDGNHPFHAPRLMDLLVPVALGGFVVAAISGSLLFMSQPVAYLNTPVFLVKMGLLALAGVNMLLFHNWFRHAGSRWTPGRANPARARLAGLLSIALWLSVLTAGRFIGFVLAV